jgi:hypothetical protein
LLDLSDITTISVTVEDSCKNHPLLAAGAILPKKNSLTITPEILFGVGSLRCQSADLELYSYVDTVQLWQSLHQIYGRYLSLLGAKITAVATGEHLRDISEFIGVSYGLIAVNSELSVPLSRIRRFTPAGKGKRVDFEFYMNNVRYFHETKGTTIPGRVAGIREDILNQKTSTKAYCNQKGQPPASRITGSIAVYPHRKRPRIAPEVFLIDPPVDDNLVIQNMRATEDLITVLRYYQTFYAVTHLAPTDRRRTSLAKWIAGIIHDLNRGESAPTGAPANLESRPRLAEPGAETSIFKGTVFDARIARRNVAHFEDFEEATRNVLAPQTFVGVSRDVTDLITQCRWNELLGYRLDSNLGSATKGTPGTLPTGILVKNLTQPDPDWEALALNEFLQMKKTIRRQKISGSADE